MNTKNDPKGQRQNQPGTQQNQGASQSGGSQASSSERREEAATKTARRGASAAGAESAGRSAPSPRGSGVAVEEERSPNASSANHPTSEQLDLSQEEPYWRANHGRQQFAGNRSYDDLALAYRNGFEGFRDLRERGGSFDDHEPELRRRYETNKSDIKWEEARHASRAAWDRFSQPRQSEGNIDTYGDPRRT